MSSKAQKRAALARFKAARELGTGGASMLDELDDYDNDGGDDDIYDTVTEEQYREIVRARREREDFVVDDDGLGYHDDGEEHWQEDNEQDQLYRQRSTSATAALTTRALQKARKATDAVSRSVQVAAAGEGPAAAQNNRSMWEFVNKGVVGADSIGAAGGRENHTSASHRSLSSVYKSKGVGVPKKDVNALLSELDAVVAPPVKNKRARGSAGGPFSNKKPRGGITTTTSYSKVHRPSPQSCHPAAESTPVAGAARYERDNDDNIPSAWGDKDDDDKDDADNRGGVPVGRREDDAGAMTIDSPSSPVPSTVASSSAKAVRFADDSVSASRGVEQDRKAAALLQDYGGEDNDDTDGAAASAGRVRRALIRPKLAGPVPRPAAKVSSSSRVTTASSTAPPLSLTTTAAFNFAPELLPNDPSSGLSETGVTGPGLAAGQIDVSFFVKDPAPAPSLADNQGDEEGGCIGQEPSDSPYIDMFWMDVSERQGDLLLFGKVPDNHGALVSACCVIRGCVRNLYVLPRPDCGGMQQVHTEVSGLLKSVIPQKAGVSWRGKPVTRRYAFDDPDVPKTPVQYLKVVYSSHYPAPSPETCQLGGATFSKILNYSASITETFLIKRQLKGPCWIRLRNPTANSGSISHCKVEFQVATYKDVAPVRDNAPPPPPVTAVTLKFQTVPGGNNKTEIVSVAAVCHRSVSLERSTDPMQARHVQQLCLVRPLVGTPFPRDMDRELIPQVRKEVNERAMLSRLLAQIGQWDPDVLVGHNIWGYELELLISRCNDLKIGTWSKLGRCRRSDPIKKLNNWGLAMAVAGRLVCDTYLSAKELLRETTYSLTNLAATQLQTNRVEIEAVDVPQCFGNSKTIVQLALHTLLDAQLVQRLMLHLQILPLTHQLTCVAGNLWSHTLKTNRAERTEFLLLHEFHRLKYVAPEKKNAPKLDAKSAKAKYAGGLVLEPKKGLYDSFILLLDFNSLYPSIIQEYNLCFTTIDWAQFKNPEDEGETSNLPPFPSHDVERGVLPRVIQSLVERRRNVKKMMKLEKNLLKKAELDIRQQALKLTANSMYGCLGFSNSRFFAQPIAAMVTSMGRETLQRTVDIAQNTVGLEVIYGDTDSIMINTRLNEESDLRKVRELGERVKKEVNRLYKTLELEIDGIFRSMLLLKKKKYAAKTVEELPNGQIKYGQELKGLDLVRRDWCIQSKDTGRYVTDQILSGQDSEIVIQNILSHLEALAGKMRSGELALDKYVITKGLSKHPNDYPDANAQPHVHVAKMMLASNRPVNAGDHIPYIITAPVDESNPDAKQVPSATERARHPEDIARSGGALKPDVEWYLVNQILPPITRLCEPIEGLSQQVLADKLGLDASKFNHSNRAYENEDNDMIDYTPASLLKDEERFKGVRKLRLYCSSCGNDCEFPGVFHIVRDEHTGTEIPVSGLRCTNLSCTKPSFFGQSNHFECHARVANTMSIWVRGLMIEYYEGLVRCDEPGCGLETRQLSVVGNCCLRRGCHGQLLPVDSELELQTHLKYLETLFDHAHAISQLEARHKSGSKTDVKSLQLTNADRATFDELHQIAKKHLDACNFNWIGPSFWKGLLGPNAKRDRANGFIRS